MSFSLSDFVIRNETPRSGEVGLIKVRYYGKQESQPRRTAAS